MFKNKSILITGGTGSFGKTLTHKLLKFNPKEIRIFSRDEKKQEDMRNELVSKKIKYFIGDVKDKNSIIPAIENISYVFHAAALKQVPSCEFYPNEAVKTNILGTENVINSSVEANVRKVVLLSTDKAVYPINAMGMSKALAEKYLIAKSRTLVNKKTILCATRYGNVMGSRGSVIPLFVNQIKRKKDITLTDPKMTRFMMTLDDSVNLVFYAFKHGKQGDIFVQKSPATSMLTLAKSLNSFFKSKSKIRIIGTRHGEKLFETLISREEKLRAQEIDNFFRIPADNRDLNFNQYFEKGETALSKSEDYTSHNTTRLNIELTKKLLMKINLENLNKND